MTLRVHEYVYWYDVSHASNSKPPPEQPAADVIISKEKAYDFVVY